MKRISQSVVAVALGMALYFASHAGATLVFQDDYQSHAVGSALHNLVPPVGEGYYWAGANHYGYIDDNTTNPPGGAAGVQFVGGLASLAGYGQQNLVINAADEIAATNKVVQFNLDAYVVGTTAQNIGLDLSTFASGGVYIGRAWDVILQTNGTVAVYDNGGNHNIPGASFRTDRWVPVQVLADYGAGTFQATVDGFSFNGSFSTDPGNNTLRRLSVGEAGYSPAFIDNVSIQIVPEPSVATLLVGSLVGLLACNCRKIGGNRRSII